MRALLCNILKIGEDINLNFTISLVILVYILKSNFILAHMNHPLTYDTIGNWTLVWKWCAVHLFISVYMVWSPTLHSLYKYNILVYNVYVRCTIIQNKWWQRRQKKKKKICGKMNWTSVVRLWRCQRICKIIMVTTAMCAIYLLAYDGVLTILGKSIYLRKFGTIIRLPYTYLITKLYTIDILYILNMQRYHNW